MDYRWSQTKRTERNRQEQLYLEGLFLFANQTTFRSSLSYLRPAFRRHLRRAPRAPSSAAADLARSSSSSSSPVAMRMTFTDMPITSAGRFSPRGPLGTTCLQITGEAGNFV